jgi:hypothetical protein
MNAGSLSWVAAQPVVAKPAPSCITSAARSMGTKAVAPAHVQGPRQRERGPFPGPSRSGAVPWVKDLHRDVQKVPSEHGRSLAGRAGCHTRD